MDNEIITLKIKNGHQIWIRKGHPRDVSSPDKKFPHPFQDFGSFPFPFHGYKYFGIYVKKITKEDKKLKWKHKQNLKMK